MEMTAYLPHIITLVNAFGIFLLGSRYKRMEEAKRLDAQTTMKEMDDRRLLTKEVLDELHRTKEELRKAEVEIIELNRKLLEEEKKSSDLTVTLHQLQGELDKLKSVMQKIDPNRSVEGCLLFGTPRCPFTKLQVEMSKVNGHGEA